MFNIKVSDQTKKRTTIVGVVLIAILLISVFFFVNKVITQMHQLNQWQMAHTNEEPLVNLMDDCVSDNLKHGAGRLVFNTPDELEKACSISLIESFKSQKNDALSDDVASRLHMLGFWTPDNPISSTLAPSWEKDLPTKFNVTDEEIKNANQ